MDKYLKYFSKSALFLIALGTVVWSVTMVKSGMVYGYGMGFWGPNGHDGIWHIALSESLAKGSWKVPVFAGEPLMNYHLGYDLLLAWIHKVSFIPIVNLYFQVLPPILSLLIGIYTFKFVYSWRKSKLQAFWATFFVYFGGSFGWIVSLLRSGEIAGESLFWSQQSISSLINPPFALSILCMLVGLGLLTKGLETKDLPAGRQAKKLLTGATFIFGILVQIKVYAGILALGGLFVAGMWRMLKRQGIDLVKVFTGALIVSILVFFPMSKSVSSVVIFKPFWFLETMMGFSDRLNWPKFAEAMVNYKFAGNFIKGTAAYVIAFVIFMIGNFGTRLGKDIWIFRKLKDFKKLNYIDVFFICVIGAGIILPMFFIQKGTAWNTIQFMYYSLLFSGIVAGVWLGEFLEKSKSRVINYLLLAVIIFLTIPTTIGTLKHYLPSRPPAKISKEELVALKFLAEQPEGVVLTLPFDRKAADEVINNPPRPLYLYESTAYVSAFAKKPVYLEDEVNLDIMDYDWKNRRANVEQFFNSNDDVLAKEFLAENNISYIYLVGGKGFILSKEELRVENIFENNVVKIYRVN